MHVTLAAPSQEAETICSDEKPDYRAGSLGTVRCRGQRDGVTGFFNFTQREIETRKYSSHKSTINNKNTKSQRTRQQKLSQTIIMENTEIIKITGDKALQLFLVHDHKNNKQCCEVYGAFYMFVHRTRVCCWLVLPEEKPRYVPKNRFFFYSYNWYNFSGGNLSWL